MEELKDNNDWGNNFQTPENVCRYMASFLPQNAGDILEPTPGKGNLVSALKDKGNVMIVDDFWILQHKRFDWIVMNPPFSPMKDGYKILYKCMEMSDHIIALLPYLAIINGEKRTADIMNFGLKSITHLPRSTFKGSRVQTCILELNKGFTGETIFKIFNKND